MTNDEIATAVIEDLTSRGLEHEYGPEPSARYGGLWIGFIAPGDGRYVSILVQDG